MVAKRKPTRRFITPLREVVTVRQNARRALDWRWGYGWWHDNRGAYRDWFNTSWVIPCDMRDRNAL